MDGLIIFVGLIVIYLLPSIIAEARGHMNKNSICVINLFFGWTIVGWVLCLAWSLSGNTRSEHARHV